MTALTPAGRTVAVAESVDVLLQGCERREPWRTADALSGSRFERVVIDGAPHVVKYISVEDDWIMRATGDLGRRQLNLLASDVLAALRSLPGCDLARMSGSGSTCFGLFASATAAQCAADALHGESPHWWVRATALGSG